MIKAREYKDIEYPFIEFAINLGNGTNEVKFTRKAFIELWNKMGVLINTNHELTSTEIYESLNDIYK